MTRKQMQARASSIRSQLVALSRDGWATAKASDYQPLESELRELNYKLRMLERAAFLKANPCEENP